MTAEPVVVALSPAGILAVVLLVLSAFHIFTPDEAQATALYAVAALLTAAGAWFARRRVTPNDKVLWREGDDLLPPRV